MVGKITIKILSNVTQACCKYDTVFDLFLRHNRNAYALSSKYSKQKKKQRKTSLFIDIADLLWWRIASTVYQSTYWPGAKCKMWIGMIACVCARCQQKDQPPITHICIVPEFCNNSIWWMCHKALSSSPSLCSEGHLMPKWRWRHHF